MDRCESNPLTYFLCGGWSEWIFLLMDLMNFFLMDSIVTSTLAFQLSPYDLPSYFMAISFLIEHYAKKFKHASEA